MIQDSQKRGVWNIFLLPANKHLLSNKTLLLLMYTDFSISRSLGSRFSAGSDAKRSVALVGCGMGHNSASK